MNYYWWKATNGREGNVYDVNEASAKMKIETLFDVEVEDIQLLQENVKTNRFNGKQFK